MSHIAFAGNTANENAFSALSACHIVFAQFGAFATHKNCLLLSLLSLIATHTKELYPGAFCCSLVTAYGHKKKERQNLCLSFLGGDYLLSHFRSTIGVVRLNFSVRNGKRWNPHAVITFALPFSAALFAAVIS